MPFFLQSLLTSVTLTILAKQHSSEFPWKSITTPKYFPPYMW